MIEGHSDVQSHMTEGHSDVQSQFKIRRKNITPNIRLSVPDPYVILKTINENSHGIIFIWTTANAFNP